MREAKQREDMSLDDLSEIETYPDHSSWTRCWTRVFSSLHIYFWTKSRIIFKDAAGIFFILYFEYCWRMGIGCISKRWTSKSFGCYAEWNEWKLAIDSELTSLEKNKTWELCVLPEDRNAIPVKWIFKRKLVAAGKFCRYKARLVCQGFIQREGIDYLPVAIFPSLDCWLILLRFTSLDWFSWMSLRQFSILI